MSNFSMALHFCGVFSYNYFFFFDFIVSYVYIPQPMRHTIHKNNFNTLELLVQVHHKLTEVETITRITKYIFNLFLSMFLPPNKNNNILAVYYTLI